MAIATAYTAIDMNAIGIWNGVITVATSSHFQVLTGPHQTDYYGKGLTFSPIGITGGTVTSYASSYNGLPTYSVTDISLNAISVGNFLNLGDANGLLNYAFSGNDVFNGSSGNDVINAYSGDDIVYGNAGNDSLNGDAGDDRLGGGAGNDILLGGSGSDILTGGSVRHRCQHAAGWQPGFRPD